jgi:hypothetical protein
MMTSIIWILGVIAFFVFVVIPVWRLFSFLRDKSLSGKPAVDKQIGSIENHNLATGLNSAGLGFGIVLVFYGGMFDERFLTVGVFVVLGSIVSFLVFEWVASKYDQLVAKEPTPPTIIELNKADLKDIFKDVKVEVAMPESLKFVYPSGAGGQVGTSQQSTERRS